MCYAIQSTLERHAPDTAARVRVEMRAGEVRLSGQVPRWQERTAAGYAPGVCRVVDGLKVAVGA